MKKFLILMICVVLSLSVVGCGGCSGGTPTKTIVWDYEKLTYEVSEHGSDTTGVLEMSVEKLNQDIEYMIPQINEDGSLKELKVQVESGCHVIEGFFTFGDDVLTYRTVTTSDFYPLYSYKSLVIGAESSAYTGEDSEPTCSSYIMTAVYDKASKTSTADYLRRRTFGENGWDGTFSADYWNHFRKKFSDVGSNYFDVNQLYYAVRCMDNLTEDDFSYTCYVPMVLEVNTKTLYCTSEPKYSVDVTKIPYVLENYGASYGLYATQTTITPQDSNVTGKGISVYYAESPLYSREQIKAGALNPEGSTIEGLKKVPVMIQENIAISNKENINGRGTITYKLTDISTERPAR